MFLALTVAIITIVSMLYPVHDEIYTALAKNFVLIFIGFVGCSFAVRGAFWLAGGRAPYEKIISDSEAAHVVYTFSAIDFCLIVLWSYIGVLFGK